MIDCPHDLSTAVTLALTYLGFYEMMEDEQPDESIWGHPERLEEWFEAIKERRKNPNSEPITSDEPEMIENELTRQYRKKK